jgi:hypothetical protein
MTLPGFTAESSLQPPTAQYRPTSGRGRTAGRVTPQQWLLGSSSWPWWWRCPPGCIPTGDPRRPCFCWSTHLPDLSP